MAHTDSPSFSIATWTVVQQLQLLCWTSTAEPLTETNRLYSSTGRSSHWQWQRRHVYCCCCREKNRQLCPCADSWTANTSRHVCTE